MREPKLGSDRPAATALILRWIPLCAAAEFLGIAAAALWYGAVNVLIGEPEPLLARTGAWALMTLSAVPEGLVLGGLQAIGVSWFLPALPLLSDEPARRPAAEEELGEFVSSAASARGSSPSGRWA